MTAPTPDTTSQTTLFDADSSSSNPYINILLLGNKWGGPVGSAATVYYSFPFSRNDSYWSQDFINGYGTLPGYSDITPDYVSLSPLTSSQQNGITQALNAWASVANLNFIQVNETPNSVGDIRVGFTSDGFMSPDIYAYTYTADPSYSFFSPYTRNGDIWFNKTIPAATNSSFALGSMGYFAGVHEIGHALGLDHSFAEDESEVGLPTNIDYIQYTVMSYSDLPGVSFDGQNQYYPTTPMLYDILAIQHLYGANNNYNAGDTVYEFSASQRYYQTIWDGGGNDTIKYISSTGGVINLEAGSFSQLGKTFNVGPSNSTVQKDNIAIAFNVVIENAIGGDGNDKITGNSVNNTLEGGAGNDILDGGAGADTLIGGKGNDTYIVDDEDDEVIENANEGTDLVKASVSYTLSDNVENLTLTDGSATGGNAAINGIGNALANTITGNAGDNILYGGAGVDKLIGGAGDDTYIVDLVRTGTTSANYKVALQDTITEAANAGNDSVQLRLLAGTDYSLMANATTFTLGANLENLDASNTGTTKLNLTGNTLDNTLTGNDADNILDGGKGVDTLIGGLGDDTYVLDLKLSAGSVVFDDTVTELDGTNEGIDTIKLRGTVNLTTAIDISLNLWSNIETVDASATGTTKLTLKGNDEDNTLIGNNAANILEGGLGNDILNGGAGADTMIGGKGWDTYFVDNMKDVIVELENTDHFLADEGIDTILSSISLSLANYDNVEYLTLLGKANLNATGNDGSNLLIGNAGNNILDGGGNRDDMQGGAGNDTYIVDDVNDQAIETLSGAAGGIDIVLSSVSFALNYNIENLTLTGTENIDGYGNELNNTIRGNAGNNRLGGGWDGSDTLIGGAGDDIYEVTYLFASSAKPVTQDTVIESLNAGIDSVILSAAGNNGLMNKYLMPLNVENLDAANTYSAFSHLIGNNLANYIIGNDYSHIFDGGAGVDTLVGGDSSDTYIVDLVTNINAGVTTAALQDIILEDASGAGSDTIQLRGNVKLTTATTISLSGSLGNLENLDASLTASSKLNLTGNDANNILTGNAGANTLTGGLGNDTLDGGKGADSMTGGDGDDTYIVDNISDTITEAANEGTDLIKASISYSLALTANVENLELTGTAAINGTGNDDANIITGNAGNNILDGEVGTDTLIGGKGNDTYIVDDEDDVVIENLNEGTDFIKASVSYTLSDNVENLTLTGTDDIGGSGNALANTITGNTGNNILDGGAGVDKLIGGAGDDTYIVDLVRTGTTATNYKVALQDTITEAANAGTDTVQLRLLGSTDYSAMASATTLILGANLENLDASATGTTKLNLTGNALANTLTGNDADNILDGGAGVDTLVGGLGADSLTGGTGNDYFKYITTEESTANSMDTITDFTVGVDKLDFSDLNTAQQLIFTGTSVSANSVWHLQISGDTYVYVDTNGDTVADMEIKLRGNKNLNISDFILPSTSSESSPDGAALVNRMAGEAASDRFTVVGGNNYSYSNPDSILLADGRQLTSWMYVNQSSGAYIHQIYGQFSSGVNGHSTNFLIDNLGDRPSMAQLTNGDLVVISESSGIQAQRFNISGEQITDSFTVNTYGASPGNEYGGGVQTHAKIIALSNGGYAVVWQSRDSVHPWYTENRPDTFDNGIYAKVFDNNNQAISEEFKVNTYANYDQVLPSIAAFERGGFIVCWQSEGQDNFTWGIYAQRFDANGQLLGSEFKVNTTSEGNQTKPMITSISEDTLVVVWESEYSNASHIYGQMISANGAMVGNEFIVDDNTLPSATRENTNPKVTGLTNGNFVVTWLSYNELYNDIKGQVFNAEGVKTGPEFTVNNNTGLAGVNDFSVAASDEGGFTITWADSLNGNIYSQDFYGSNIILGDNNANTITLSKTEDSYTILGFPGDDTLIGSDGNDLLNGGAGKDILIGGKGNDTYYSTLIDDTSRAEYAKLEDTITELPNEGIDTLVLVSESISNLNNTHFEIPENIENVDATAISLNQLKIIGNDSNNIIQSGKSYNEIYAMGGDDVIYINGIGTSVFTGLGNDTVYGSENYDYIVDTTDYSVMGGNDTIYGYGGNDQIQALMGNDFVDGGDGNDIIYAGSYFVTYMIFPQINTFSDNDTVYGGEGNDYIDGGAWGYDYLYGGAGDDILIGGLVLEAAAYGATGKAYLDGGSGNDHIYGMASDDTLIGGQGRDELTGGAGSDIFKWSAGDITIVQSISERTDTITDFSVSERDKLDLRDLLSEESASNILNYLDVVAQDDSTIIRISANGSFGSSGAYNATVEDARIVLSGIDLFAITGTSSEAELIGQMITNQTLLIG